MGSNRAAYALGYGSLVLLFALGSCVVVSAAQAQPAEGEVLPTGALPWAEGQTLAERWTVKSISRHPEYVRYGFTGPEGTSRLEVARSQGQDDPWSSLHYRVQPSPGGKAPEPLLRAALAALRSWETRPGHQPFVGRAFDVSDKEAPDDVSVSRPQGASQTLTLVFPLLLLGWLLSGACLWSAGRDSEDRWPIALLFPGAILGSLVSWWVMGPGDIPVDWITILHEGSVDRTIRALWGEGNHGPVFTTLTLGLTPRELLPIRGAVGLNLALHVGNTIGFMLVGRLLAGGWIPGLLAAAWYGLAPMMMNAALSELPTQLLTTLFLLALGPLYALKSFPRLAVPALVVLALLAVGTRTEAALPIGVVAGGMILAHIWCWERPAFRWAVWTVGTSLALGVGWLAVNLSSHDPAWSGGPSGMSYALAALNPTDPCPALMPILLGVTLPLGGVLLGLWGLLDAPRRGAMWALLVVALWMLFRMYFTAGHRGEAPYELMRYGSMMFPIWVLLALRGWVALEGWLESRQLSGRRRHLAVAVVLGSQLLLMPDGVTGRLVPDHHRTAETVYEVPLQRDQQEEARLLIGLIEEHPDCVIATTGARDPRLGEPISGWDHVLFGGPVDRPITLPRDPQRLSRRMAGVAGVDACRIFYGGLDCSIEKGVDCAEEVSGRLPTGQRDLSGRPYYDHVTRASPLGVAVYPLTP
ncbi:MAG: hypothetical protein VYE15_02170 [Myxococcota bacterium]|nr:hypothetical protein [Myxococcota bacterium]